MTKPPSGRTSATRPTFVQRLGLLPTLLLPLAVLALVLRPSAAKSVKVVYEDRVILDLIKPRVA